MNRPWTIAELRRLRIEHAEGRSAIEIAMLHGRTIRACQARIVRLGLGRPGRRRVEDMAAPEAVPLSREECRILRDQMEVCNARS